MNLSGDLGGQETSVDETNELAMHESILKCFFFFEWAISQGDMNSNTSIVLCLLGIGAILGEKQ